METQEVIERSITQAQEFNGALSAFLENRFLIDGKTMKEWKRHFYVNIPEEINLANLVRLSVEVGKKYQEAGYHREKQTTQLVLLEQAKGDKFHDAYNSIRHEHEEKFSKTLAAESCRVAATLAIKDIENAISNQKVIRDFWVKICDTLVEVRKHLELIGYALSADLRLNRDFVVRVPAEK